MAARARKNVSEKGEEELLWCWQGWRVKLPRSICSTATPFSSKACERPTTRAKTASYSSSFYFSYTPKTVGGDGREAAAAEEAVVAEEAAVGLPRGHLPGFPFPLSVNLGRADAIFQNRSAISLYGFISTHFPRMFREGRKKMKSSFSHWIFLLFLSLAKV
jgi:hypothetical protein